MLSLTMLWWGMDAHEYFQYIYTAHFLKLQSHNEIPKLYFVLKKKKPNILYNQNIYNNSSSRAIIWCMQ